METAGNLDFVKFHVRHDIRKNGEPFEYFIQVSINRR